MQIHEGKDTDMVAMFQSLVEFRVNLEYTYYQHTDNVDFLLEVVCQRDTCDC